VAQDSHHRESHARIVAVSVPDEDFRWEFIVSKQSKSSHQEWDHQGQGEKMIGVYFFSDTQFKFLHKQTELQIKTIRQNDVVKVIPSC